MAGAQQNGKKKKSFYAPVSFLIICAALVLGMSVFFRVADVEVTGNSLYSAEEIIEASGIEEGDNLFFINRITAISRIFSKLPYVEGATINRSLPNRLVIEITESTAIAYVTAEDGIWTIDRNCKLLSRTDPETASLLIRVDGLTPIAPAVGETIAPGEAETPKVAYLTDILRHISSLGMSSDVAGIDVANIANPTFDYLGRFKVKLGNNEDLDYKFQLLLSAVSKLEAGDSGTLDLSIDNRAHLTYD